MNPWTDEQHKAAREVVRVVAEAPVLNSGLRKVVQALGETLDEIERLRAALAAASGTAGHDRGGEPWRVAPDAPADLPEDYLLPTEDDR